LRITYSGRTPADLSTLVAATGGPVHLLQAGIERIQGHAVGHLLIAAAGTEAEVRLRAIGETVERIGYVAADD